MKLPDRFSSYGPVLTRFRNRPNVQVHHRGGWWVEFNPFTFADIDPTKHDVTPEELRIIDRYLRES